MSAPRSWSLQTTRRNSSRASLKKNRRRTRRPHIETLEDRCLLAASPALLSTIEGLNSSDGIFNIGGFDASPPDPHGAVGPTHVVNVANRSIQWFTKDGVRHGHTSLVNFFQPLRPLTPPFNPSANIFDPRVLYDQFAQRFVVMALERSSDPVATSRIMMAVSDDSDPNGTWYYTSINTLTNIAAADDPLEILPHYADFAGMAVNSEAIFVTANMIDFDDEEQANGSRLWIIDKGIGKGGFYENGRARWTVHNPGLDTQVDYSVNQENVGRLRSMYPAHIYGSAPASLGTFLVMYDGRTNMTDEFVDVIRVDNPLTNPQFQLFSVNVGNLEYQPDPFEFDPPPEAPQPLITTTLDVGDRRVYDAVWRDGQLYFTTVVVPFEGPDTNQTTAYWFRLDTTAASASPPRVTLADQGPISGEDVAVPSYTSFPSIAVDGFGNMAVSFALFGPGIFPSAFYALRTPDDPPGTLRDSVMLAEGFDAYEQEDFDGLISWGRHTGLAIDPLDDVTFWTYNAYSLPRFDLDGRWGSRWGSFRQGAAPDLPPPGPTTIRGVVWQDLNGNGVLDEGEPVIPDALVYVDLDGDGRIDLTEPTVRTNALGRYSITVEVDGPIIVRESPRLGWQSTYPGQPGLVWQPPSPPQDASPFWQNYFPGGSNDAHIIVIPEGGGGTISNVDFGRIDTNFDWGNAPEPWPTLRVDNGARHPVVASYGLGQLTLATPDGQPNVDAEAPDNDGVVMPSTVATGDTFAIAVTNRGTGFLQGWIDWNGDGDWNDAGEQVLTNVELTSPGTRTFNITVPPDAEPGTTYARFRYGKEGNLGPTGPSTREGEVEDYRIEIVSLVPSGKLVEIQLVATDLNGDPLQNNTIQTGQDFLVSAFVQDIRETYPDGQPFPDNLKGVFSAYLDVLYPTILAAPVPSTTSGFGYDIQFAEPFTEGQKAGFLTASGLIDEVGAFRSSVPLDPPNHPDPQPLFTTRFTALFPPGGIGSLTFNAVNATLPESEVSLIRSGVVDPNTGVDLGLSVPPSQVFYVSTGPITVIGAVSEGEFTNPNNPFDVNDDGYVTPMDALFVMNFLNTHGSIDLRNLAGGEGETGKIHYYDTNGDGVISPVDVLGIINYLNLQARQAGHGEGEGEAGSYSMADEIAALVIDPPAMATMIGMVDAAEARMLMAEAEAEALQEFSSVDPTARSVDDAYRLSSLQDGQDEREETSWWLEDDLVEDVAQAWQVSNSLDSLLDALV